MKEERRREGKGKERIGRERRGGDAVNILVVVRGTTSVSLGTRTALAAQKFFSSHVGTYGPGI